MSARRGAQFVFMGMPIICWKTSREDHENVVNVKLEHLDNAFFSVQCPWSSNQSVPSQIRVSRDLEPNICISDFHFCEGRGSGI